MHYQRNVTCCLDEWRLVVLELDASDSAWSSLMQQRRGQPAGGVASHEALPSLAFLEHPSWRLAGSVVAAASK
jgi:hypothetical protein